MVVERTAARRASRRARQTALRCNSTLTSMLKTFVRRRFQIPLRPPRTCGRIRQAAQRRGRRPHARRSRSPHVRPHAASIRLRASPRKRLPPSATVREGSRGFTTIRRGSRQRREPPRMAAPRRPSPREPHAAAHEQFMESDHAARSLESNRSGRLCSRARSSNETRRGCGRAGPRPTQSRTRHDLQPKNL